MSDTYQIDDDYAPAPVDFVTAQRRATMGNVMSSLDDNPDDAVRAKQISEGTGIPTSVVNGDLEHFEKQYKATLAAGIIDRNNFIRDYITAHPIAAQASNDDWGQLDGVSESLVTLGDKAILHKAFEGFKDGFDAEGMVSEHQRLADLLQKTPVFGNFFIRQATLAGAAVLAGGMRTISGLVQGAAAGAAQDYKQATGGSDAEAARLTRDLVIMANMAMSGQSNFHIHPEVQAAIKEASKYANKIEPFLQEGKPPPAGFDPITDEVWKEQAKVDGKNLKDVIQSSGKSNTFERDEGAIQDFVRTHNQDMNMGISAEAVRKVYGDKVPEADDNLLGSIPNLAEQLDVAEAAGGDVTVSLSNWIKIAKNNPELANQLHDFVRVREGGFTLDETKQLAEAKAAETELSAEQRPAPQFLSGDNAVDALRKQGEFDALNPLQERKLTLTKTLEREGAHVFDLNDDVGNRIGDLRIVEREGGKTLYIAWVGAGERIGQGIREFISLRPNGFGPRALRDLIEQLRQEFPNAETIAGNRVTGARAAVAEEKGVEPRGELVRVPLRGPTSKHLTDFAQTIPGWEFAEAGFPEGRLELPPGADFTPVKVETKGGEATSIANYTVRQAIEHMDTADLNPLSKALYQFFGERVKELVGDVPIRVITREDMNLIKGPEHAAFYSPKSHTITIAEDTATGAYGKTDTNSVLMHEMAHAITARSITTDTRVARDVLKLLNETKGLMKVTNPKGLEEFDYAFTRPVEFMAEAWSNPRFQETLASLPMSPQLAERLGMAEKRGTIWDAVKTIVGDLMERLFGSRPDDSLLDGVMKVTSNIERKVGEESKLLEPGTEYMRGKKFVEFSQERPTPMWKTTATEEAQKILTHYKGDLWAALQSIDSHPFWGREEAINRAADIKNAIIESALPKETERVLKIEKDFREREGMSYSQYRSDIFGAKMSHPQGLTDWKEWFDKFKQGELPSPLKELSSKRPTQLELPEAGTTRVEDQAIFARANAMGITQKMLKGILDLVAKQRGETQEAQLKKAQAEQARTQTKEWKENRAAMLETVKEDVTARPDVAADELLRTGRIWGKKFEKVKLSSEGMTPEQIATIPKEYLSKTGLSPSEMASWFGYTSGEELVNRLAMLEQARLESGLKGKPFIDDLIKKETDRQMEVKYGKLKDNILQEAKDQVLTDSQLDLMHEWLVALADAHKYEFSFTKEQIAEALQKKFNGSTVGDITSDKYLSAAGKAVRGMTEQFIKENPAEAFKKMQEQYFATALAKIATRFEKRQAKFDRTTKSLAPREAANMDQQFRNWAHDIMMRVGRKVKRSPLDLETEIAKSDHATMEAFITNKEAELGEMPIAEFLRDPKFRQDYDSLTVDQANKVHDAVETLAYQGRKVEKLEKAGEEAALDEKKAEMMAQLIDFKQKHYDAKGQRWVISGASTKALEEIRKFGVAHLQLESLLNRWDRGNPNGVWTQYVMRDLATSATTERQLEKFYKKMMDEFKEYSLQKEKTFNNPVLMDPFALARGEKVPIVLNHENVRAIVANMGNPSNFDKMVRGFSVGDYKIDPEVFRQWIYSITTKEDWDWAQQYGKLFKHINENWVDKMYRRITGIAPEKVAIEPIETPFGTYEGWYYPIMYHPLWEGTSRKLMGGDALEGPNYVRATTPHGYIEKRTGYAGPIDLSLDRGPSRLRQIIHDVSYREAILNASKIFYDKDVRAVIANHYNKEARDMLIPYLKDVANSASLRNEISVLDNKLGEVIRQNAISVLVGLNPGTVAKHFFTALYQSMHEVGYKEFGNAMFSLTVKDLDLSKSNWAFAMEHSGELPARIRNYREVLRGGTENVFAERDLRSAMIEIGSVPVAFSDLLSAVPTWLAQYKKTMEETGIHGDAVFMADRAVRRAHGSTAITNRPEVMRSRNLWFTSLYGFFNHIMNRQYEMAWKAHDAIEDRKEPEKLVRTKDGTYIPEKATVGYQAIPGLTMAMMAYVIVPALVEEMVSPLPADRNESWFKWGAKALTKDLSSSWVYARDMAHAFLSGRDPQAGLVSTAYSMLTNEFRDIGKDRPFSKDHMGRTIQDSITLFGLATGLTNQQVGRDARFMHDYLTGQQKPRGFGDWYRGLRYGTIKERH